jgi:hypothetical protein
MPGQSYVSITLNTLYQALRQTGSTPLKARAQLRDLLEYGNVIVTPKLPRMVDVIPDPDDAGVTVHTPDGASIPGSKIRLCYRGNGPLFDPSTLPPPAQGKDRSGAPITHDWPVIQRLDEEYCRTYCTETGRWPNWKDRWRALERALRARVPHVKTLQEYYRKLRS